jgi:hypothetical protein
MARIALDSVMVCVHLSSLACPCYSRATRVQVECRIDMYRRSMQFLISRPPSKADMGGIEDRNIATPVFMSGVRLPEAVRPCVHMYYKARLPTASCLRTSPPRRVTVRLYLVFTPAR